jgi:hypothetical protein
MERQKNNATMGKFGFANPTVNILFTIKVAPLKLSARKNIQAKVTKAKTDTCFTTVGTFSR